MIRCSHPYNKGNYFINRIYHSIYYFSLNIQQSSQSNWQSNGNSIRTYQQYDLVNSYPEVFCFFQWPKFFKIRFNFTHRIMFGPGGSQKLKRMCSHYDCRSSYTPQQTLNLFRLMSCSLLFLHSYVIQVSKHIRKRAAADDKFVYVLKAGNCITYSKRNLVELI